MENIYHRHLESVSSRLSQPAFRYFPYIVFFCFAIYIAIVIICSCVIREPRFIVRWNKEKRASQITLSDTEDNDEEEEEEEGEDGEEESTVKESGGENTNTVNNLNNSGNDSTFKRMPLQRGNTAEQSVVLTEKHLLQHKDIDLELQDEENDELEEEKRLKSSCCRKYGLCYSCGPSYYRYGLHLSYHNIWGESLPTYLLLVFRLASFAYLFYYNIYVIAAKNTYRDWEPFAVWVSCAVIAYFFCTSCLSLFGIATCLHPQDYTAKRRAYIVAAAAHSLFEIALINSVFVTLLNHLYFNNRYIFTHIHPNPAAHDNISTNPVISLWTVQQIHLRLLPALCMVLEAAQNELYVRWQHYPVTLLLPGAYLVYVWISVLYTNDNNSNSNDSVVWPNTILSTSSAHGFAAYAGLLAAHVAIFVSLGVGVLSYGKLRCYVWWQEHMQSDDDDDIDDEAEEEDEENEEEDEENSKRAEDEDGEEEEEEVVQAGRAGVLTVSAAAATTI